MERTRKCVTEECWAGRRNGRERMDEGGRIEVLSGNVEEVC